LSEGVAERLAVLAVGLAWFIAGVPGPQAEAMTRLVKAAKTGVYSCPMPVPTE